MGSVKHSDRVSVMVTSVRTEKAQEHVTIDYLQGTTETAAVHRAKVPRSHSDNGSDIQKMLESRRKQFKKILEKEFDKRGQFKFALCSLTKFLIDDKPGNDKPEKKNSQTDWLRNKQIIVNNKAEIDDYLSNAFEQILYQVEERGGKSNA
ncbi:6597_t:CDS:2 [Rhizophagus irregularis]|nr:6597_t:CDS:2 [Rhizophagus irregularis]